VSDGYPAEIQKHLSLSYSPKCELCHEGADGGVVDTPFAKSMLARGMRGGGDVAALDSALDAMAKDRVDSDGDGATDLDELAYGGDPNVASKAEGSGPAPGYGCAATSGDNSLAIAFALIVVIVARGRGRARGV
jgi:hypothetical protein